MAAPLDLLIVNPSLTWWRRWIFDPVPQAFKIVHGQFNQAQYFIIIISVKFMFESCIGPGSGDCYFCNRFFRHYSAPPVVFGANVSGSIDPATWMVFCDPVAILRLPIIPAFHLSTILNNPLDYFVQPDPKIRYDIPFLFMQITCGFVCQKVTG